MVAGVPIFKESTANIYCFHSRLDSRDFSDDTDALKAALIAESARAVRRRSRRWHFKRFSVSTLFEIERSIDGQTADQQRAGRYRTSFLDAEPRESAPVCKKKRAKLNGQSVAPRRKGKSTARQRRVTAL
jgi:hypothetical protein